MKHQCALFAGTFEIFHEGHIDVLVQAASIFHQVYVAVSLNPNKQSSPLKKRHLEVTAIVNTLKLKNVTVIINRGYGFLCAKKHKCNYLIRGIRDVNDIAYELDLAARNYVREPKIRTIFIVAKNELKAVSASRLLAEKKRN